MLLCVLLKLTKIKLLAVHTFCEAQGKGRARGRPRKVTQRSFIDSGWWMVDILSLMLYIKVGCHLPTRTFNFTQLMARWGSGGLGGGKGKCVG